MTELTPSGQFDRVAKEIADEVIQARADTSFKRNVDLVEGYWNVGRAFVDHPQYKKFGKQQGELFATVAKITRMGERSLRYCVQFYEKYELESFEDVLPRLAGGKSPIWRDIVHELPSGRREEPADERPKCRHCPEHCPQ